MLTMVNPIDFGGHSSRVKVMTGIIDKCGVRGDATLCVVIFIIYSVRSNGKVAFKVSKLCRFPLMNDFTLRCLHLSDYVSYFKHLAIQKSNWLHLRCEVVECCLRSEVVEWRLRCEVVECCLRSEVVECRLRCEVVECFWNWAMESSILFTLSSIFCSESYNIIEHRTTHVIYP